MDRKMLGRDNQSGQSADGHGCVRRWQLESVFHPKLPLGASEKRTFDRLALSVKRISLKLMRVAWNGGRVRYNG